ncbi:MAG: hypothetical protein N2170_08755 [Bacteroidia bacterium]|nr:hypothetical protein [Bacteroidia bacterium]
MTIDPAGVALLSIQALADRVEAQERRIQTLEWQLRHLLGIMDSLQTENAYLREKVSVSHRPDNLSAHIVLAEQVPFCGITLPLY